MAANGFSFEEASKPVPSAPAAQASNGFSFEEASAPTMPAMATEDAYGQFPPQDAPAVPQAPSAPLPTLDEFGRDVSAPAAGQSGFDEVVSRVGKAAKQGYDESNLVEPAGMDALDKADRDSAIPILSGAARIGNAALGVVGGATKGALEGIAATGDVVGDAAGMPGIGQFARGVAGMGESAMADAMGSHVAAPMDVRTGVDLARDASNDRFQAAQADRNANAVAEIGRAPDIDTAIKAAGDAVSRPADLTLTVRPDPTDIAPAPDAAALPDRDARVQAERDRINAMRPAANDAVAPEAAPVPDLPADLPPTDPSPAEQASAPTPATPVDDSSAPASSVGAAATADLDPGLGDMTPKQVAAYRATAEGDRLVQSPEYGVPDNTEYVRGVIVNSAERAGTVEAARELKAIATQHPEIAAEQRRVNLQNADMREQKLNQITGTPVDIDNAKAAIDAQRDADVANVWPNKTAADIQPVLDTARDILASGEGRRSLVAGVVRDVVRNLYDDDGQPITDPEVLYGVGKHINDLLDKNDAGGKKVNEAARAQLMQLKTALYDDVIEPAAPGFKQSLDNYAQSSRAVDEMKALQSVRPGMFGPDGLTYTKVNAAMKRIVDARQRPGLNDFKSISDDTMANLWDLRDDLRRSAFADRNASARGSDTMQNAVDNSALLKSGVGRALGRGAVSMVPVLRNAVKTFNDVRDPIVEANEARLRVARGMAILRPDEPTVPRQDVAPRPANFVPTPVQARGRSAQGAAPVPKVAELSQPPVTQGDLFSALTQAAQSVRSSSEANVSVANAVAKADPHTALLLSAALGDDFHTSMPRAKLTKLLSALVRKMQSEQQAQSKVNNQ